MKKEFRDDAVAFIGNLVKLVAWLQSPRSYWYTTLQKMEFLACSEKLFRLLEERLRRIEEDEEREALRIRITYESLSRIKDLPPQKRRSRRLHDVVSRERRRNVEQVASREAAAADAGIIMLSMTGRVEKEIGRNVERDVMASYWAAARRIDKKRIKRRGEVSGSILPVASVEADYRALGYGQVVGENEILEIWSCQ